MTVQIVPGFERPHQIRELFTEYTKLIIDQDRRYHEFLMMQNYEDELLHPEQKYSPPTGRLYLAYCDQALAGCIALRQLDETRCEMKRLYVRPGFRKQHIGSILVRRIINDAKSIGYKYLLLDTFPFLDVAVRMYERMGFRYIPRYNDSPMDSTIYMQLDL